MDIEIIIQILCGGYKGEAVSFEEVERKLSSVLPRLPVRKVIMGWNPDRKLYEKTAAYLAKRNIELYLWLSVFSETCVMRDLAALVDINGRRIERKEEHEGEDFSFSCPGDRHNIEKILDIYENEFASIPFSGVFLDKIRYPSFANGYGPGQGYSGVFSCFCPSCLATYEKENFDIARLKSALARLAFGPASGPSKSYPAPLSIREYRGNGEYLFEEEALASFFSQKSRVISESLKSICQYFRDKGLGIGLDVFAPFLSPFVGQDLRILSGLCDFIKPMMYRVTQAPAGMPFETGALLRETNCSRSQSSEFYRLLGINPAKYPFDLDFASRDLAGMAASSSCPVYAGMEINRVPTLAETSPGYVAETIRAYSKTGVKGFALSWSILDAPEENIIAAEEAINTL